VDSASDAIVYIDNDEVIRSWNRGAAAMFEYSAEEVIGQKFHKLLPEGSESELQWIRGEMERVGTIRNFETVRVTKTRSEGPREPHADLAPQRVREAGRVRGHLAGHHGHAGRSRNACTVQNESRDGMARVGDCPRSGDAGSTSYRAARAPAGGLSEGDPKRRSLEIIVSQIDRICAFCAERSRLCAAGR